ncbi:MAG: YifB family Mg chelatase-like AAA ATPase [Spirochaetes bacterium]|nr:YifB family Mg chelatase-like AAA ATPase [Spirochaetota bacterium]
MLSKIITASLAGINPFFIYVETFLSRGLPAFNIIGLPDKIINESKDRIISAIKNSEIEFPVKKIIINLAPAGIKKENIILDLPIAAGILVSMDIVKIKQKSKNYVFLGELSLDGSIKGINGLFPILNLCKNAGIYNIIIPYENLEEAKLIGGLNLISVKNIKDMIEKVNNNYKLIDYHSELTNKIYNRPDYSIDFSDVKGNHHVKRALEIAAAGMHNVIMIGPPGTGKSMLAKRMITIMPELNMEEAIETTTIYSSKGLLSRNTSLVVQRPFRSPHHTSSDISIIGGGRILQCGEISLAHNGILFFDEFPQFKNNVIQALREPMVEGSVTVSRVSGTICFPASFMLIAAMNPCPCGYLGSEKHECRCSLKQIKTYYSKITGPILDRIDIQIEIPQTNFLNYRDEIAENSATLRERIIKVHKIQQLRSKRLTSYYNAYLDTNEIKKFIALDSSSLTLLNKAIDALGLSPRSYFKTLKIARTIADLEGSEKVTSTHISESLQYRILDRNNYFQSDYNINYFNKKFS